MKKGGKEALFAFGRGKRAIDAKMVERMFSILISGGRRGRGEGQGHCSFSRRKNHISVEEEGEIAGLRRGREGGCVSSSRKKRIC